MTNWEYCRLFTNIIQEEEQLQSMKYAVWAHFLERTDENSLVKIFEETKQGAGYLKAAATLAAARVHLAVGLFGARGWELVSINHQEIFYQDKYGPWFVPSFYFKRPLGA